MTDVKKHFVFRLNDHGQGPELVRQIFLERGWLEFDDDTQHESDWNMWWRTSRFRICDYENIFPWQRLNHYPKSTGITKKDCLVRNLRRMKGVHGAGVFNFSPLSFNLPNDYTRYVAEYGKLRSKMDPRLFSWICKPADMSRGRGIFLFRDISELQYDCNAVVQQYIANPLLIGGYKFDIRIYVAVPSFHPLTVYVFQEGIVRFSTEKYDLSSLHNVFAHLTNTSINKHSPSYTADKERIGPGCKWTITQLRYYLHQNDLDDTLLWTKITNIIILTLLIQAPQVPKERNCCELYGFDILIDENLKPWLLEVNFSPALNTDCQVDIMVKKPMLHSLLDMLNFKESDKERGGLEKRINNGRITARARMKSGKGTRSDPIDRTQSSSRLSQRGGIQRMSSTISSVYKGSDVTIFDETLSFIQQDNPAIDKKGDENVCFGLPLVHPSDDDKDDSDTQSEHWSVKSDFIEQDICVSQSGRFTPLKSNWTFNSQLLEKVPSTLERIGTASSVVRKLESTSVYSAKGDKISLKSLSHSDSAYSSFSDNSDKVPVTSSNTKDRIYSHRRKSFSLQSEILSETSKNNVFQIKSLRPNENSNSLRKLSNRSFTPVNNQTSNRIYGRPRVDVSISKSFDRAPSRNFVSRSSSRFGNVNNARSDIDTNQRSQSQMLVSSMSSIHKLAREKGTINLGLNGTSKKPITTPKLKPRSKSISIQNNRSRGPPPRIGDFFLVFPFNEGTLKAANTTLDPHYIIKETQKLVKELKLDIDKNKGDVKVGGHIPYGSGMEAERLWGPLKPPAEETF